MAIQNSRIAEQSRALLTLPSVSSAGASSIAVPASPPFPSFNPWRDVILEHAPDGVVGTEPDQNIVDWNLQTENLFGWTKHEAVGRNLGDMIEGFSSTHLRIKLTGVHRDGSTFPVELTTIPVEIDGRKLFYSFVRSPAEDSSFAQAVVQPVQVLRRKGQNNLQTRLEQNESQFRTLAESIPQLTWITDPNGKVQWYNQKWYQYTGSTSEEMSAEGWDKIYHPDHLERVTQGFSQAVSKGEDWEDTFPLRSRTGEWRWFLSRALPVKDSKNKIVNWFGTNTDITEQKRNRESIAFLSESSVILSSSLDYRETLQRVAQIAVPKLGDWCSISILEDRSPSSLVIAHLDPEMVKIAQEFQSKYPSNWGEGTGINRVIQTGSSILKEFITDDIIQSIACDAEHLRLLRLLRIRSMLMVPIRGRTHILGVMTLISSWEDHRYNESDLKIAEEVGMRAGLAIDNARLFSQAQEAIHVRDEFLSIASHELKTPLTSLKLQTQMSIRRFEKNDRNFFEKPAIERLLNTTAKQTDRLTKLIDDMLDISRITHGKLSLQCEEFDLGEMVQDVIDRLSDVIQSSKSCCQLNREIPLKRGWWDRYRVEQVVVNLITNAVKYAAGSKIEISVAQCPHKKNWVSISVSDRGMGIAQENLDRIFQRFERAIPSNNISGLGLGLYISRQIVDAHGGTIYAKSELKKGSTFVVELPVGSRQTVSSNPLSLKHESSCF